MGTEQDRYRQALRALKQALPLVSPDYSVFLILEQRMLDILTSWELHGDNETFRTERSRISKELNDTAVRALGVDFNVLLEMAIPLDPSQAQNEFRTFVWSLLLDKPVVRRWLESNRGFTEPLFEQLVSLTIAAHSKLAEVPSLFPEYAPDANLRHILNVFDVFYDLLPDPARIPLSPYGEFLLFCACVVKDIGFSACRDHLDDIQASSAFKAFVEHERDETGRVLSDEALLREFVRRTTHTEYAKDWITDFFDRKLNSPHYGRIVARIVTALSGSVDALKDTSRFCAEQPIAGQMVNIAHLGALLIILDLFDISGSRMPWLGYDFLGPFERQYQSQTAYVADWHWHLRNLEIGFRDNKAHVHSICRQVYLYHLLRGFQSRTDAKLKEVTGLLNQYRLPHFGIYDISFSFETEGFEACDWQFSINREAVFNLLMGHALYSDTMTPLRELLQNSIDAVRQRRAVDASFQQPSITVILREDVSGNWQLIVEDNGVGMTRDVIENYFLRVGKPYYDSEGYRRRFRPEHRIQAIARFGIGFVSCFMVADRVTVDTSPYEGGSALLLDITGLMEYFTVRKGSLDRPGTRITLYLQPGIAYKKVELDTYYRLLMDYFPELEHLWKNKVDRDRTSLLQNGPWYMPNPEEESWAVLDLDKEIRGFIGFLEFPINYTVESPRIRRHGEILKRFRECVPGGFCIDFSGNIADRGLRGRVGHLAKREKEERELYSSFSQLGINIEVSRLIPQWLHAHAELDIAGPSILNLRASRESTINDEKEQQLISYLETRCLEAVLQYYENQLGTLPVPQALDNLITRVIGISSGGVSQVLYSCLPLPVWYQNQLHLHTAQELGQKSDKVVLALLAAVGKCSALEEYPYIVVLGRHEVADLRAFLLGSIPLVKLCWRDAIADVTSVQWLGGNEPSILLGFSENQSYALFELPIYGRDTFCLNIAHPHFGSAWLAMDWFKSSLLWPQALQFSVDEFNKRLSNLAQLTVGDSRTRGFRANSILSIILKAALSLEPCQRRTILQQLKFDEWLEQIDWGNRNLKTNPNLWTEVFMAGKSLSEFGLEKLVEIITGWEEIFPQYSYWEEPKCSLDEETALEAVVKLLTADPFTADDFPSHWYLTGPDFEGAAAGEVQE